MQRVAVALILALAAASGLATPADAVTPAQQHALERLLLGERHADEHLARPHGRAAQSQEGFDPCRPRGPANAFDSSRPLPPERKPTGQARCGTLPRQPSTKEGLAKHGRWTRTVVDLPHYAIHATLMPTGKILFWGFEWTQWLITRTNDSHQQTSSVATIWDPVSGRMKAVPPPLVDVDGDGVAEPVPLYCSGQTLLADGRILVVGGTLDLRWGEKGFRNPPGIKVALIFDPRTETWSRTRDLSIARWYPTTVKLADGRVLVLGGYDDAKENGLTRNLDVISRDGKVVTHVPAADRETWTYPGLLLMPSGRVLLGGPRPQDSGILDPLTMRWAPLGGLPDGRGGSNLVPVPTATGLSPQGMLIGGLSLEDAAKGVGRATRRTLVYDDRRSSAGWRSGPAQRRPRYWPNTLLLPDGGMLTLGGGTAHTARDAAFATERPNRRVELWDQRAKRWRLGPAQREDRTYHSVGLVLPDGRVWSAGDDANPNRDGDTAELYEPPYLHRGKRPRLVAAPATIAPRARFTVTATGASSPSRVTLLAPGATTHALDMNQRFVELRVIKRQRTGRGRWRLTVAGPRGFTAAPPGPYMLHAVSADGVPSIARWVRVG